MTSSSLRLSPRRKSRSCPVSSLSLYSYGVDAERCSTLIVSFDITLVSFDAASRSISFRREINVAIYTKIAVD